MINPGDRLNCAICGSGVIEIPLDANQEALDLLNEQIEAGDSISRLLCFDCGNHIAGEDSSKRRVIVWTGQVQ